jgi:hypothetical protein
MGASIPELDPIGLQPAFSSLLSVLIPSFDRYSIDFA